MGRELTILLGAAALAISGAAMAQQTITTPEGAQMSAASDLAYKPGELVATREAYGTAGPDPVRVRGCGPGSSRP